MGHAHHPLLLDLRTKVAYVTFVAAFLPYIRSSPLHTDVQPHFILLFFGLYIWTRPSAAWRDERLPTALVVGIFSGGLLLVLGYLQYAIAVGALPVFAVFISHEPRRIVDRAAKTATIVYLLGCALELAGRRAIVDRFLAGARDFGHRGLHSFTDEPSYLAVVSMVLFVYFLWSRQRVVWAGLCVLMALLSGSVTGILPLVVVFALYGFFGRRVGRALVAAVALVALWLWLPLVVSPSSRLGHMLALLYSDPGGVLNDVSASNRLVRSFAPAAVALKDGFIPHFSSSSTMILVPWHDLAAGSDVYVDGVSNTLSLLTFAMGIGAIPLVWVLCRHYVAPLYVGAAAIFLVVVNISIATPYAAILLALLQIRPPVSAARTVGANVDSQDAQVRSPRSQGQLDVRHGGLGNAPPRYVTSGRSIR